ncbi:condensation domain-containing protein, partial [Pseudomonas sp. No.117]
DSILSLQVVSRARQAGWRCTPKDIFEQQTIGGLAEIMIPAESPTTEQGAVVGALALTPVQRWFFEQEIPARHHWNQSVLLEAKEQVWQAATLERALRALIIQHDALRLVFDGAEAHFHPLNELETAWESSTVLAHLTLADLDEWQPLAERLQRSLELARGPLLRAVLAELPGGGQRLLLVVHHLVVDGVSWRILLEDLHRTYRRLDSDLPVDLPPKTSSLQAWSKRLHEYAHSDAARAEQAFWTTHLAAADPRLPTLDASGRQTVSDALSVETRLDTATTQRLLKVAPASYRTQINDLLLTALARVLCRWTGRDHALIQLEGHGREDLFADIDLSRTLGWFTSLYPVCLAPEPDLGRSIVAIKEQLRGIPRRGLGFGVLRYLGDAATRQALQRLPEPAITFNYLGQFADAAGEHADYAFSAGDTGANQDPQTPLGNWLTLNGQVFNGALSLTWTFGRNVFAPAVIEQLAQALRAELEGVVDHCCSRTQASLTPSDVPLAGFGQAQLDQLVATHGPIDDLYPLTPMQRQMLSDAGQVAGDFVCQRVLTLQGLQPERLRRAWTLVLATHAVLRTQFLLTEPPLQLVRSQVNAPFEIVDGRGLDARGVQDLIGEERLRPFDLTAASLLRLLVIQQESGMCQVVLTTHHILLDGWSAARLYDDLLRAYLDDALPPLANGFADYVGWLQRRDQRMQRDFWERELAPLERPCLLSAAAPAVSEDTQGHGCVGFDLTPKRSLDLERYAKRERVTVNTLVQAAWLLALHLELQRSVVACGVTFAGRPPELPDIERQLGLFIHDVPLVADFDQDLSVQVWLQQLQALNLQLREQGYVALDELQRQRGHELFDSVVVFENYPRAALAVEGETGGLVLLEMQHVEQFSTPLMLYAEFDEVWTFNLDFRRDRVEPSRGTRLAGRLRWALDWLIDGAPDRHLSDAE